MSARRFFGSEKHRAARRLQASADDILAALEDMLDATPGQPPVVKQLIARRRAWRRIAKGEAP